MHLPSLGKWFCASLFAVVLTACGGGSDGQDEPAEPVAINAMGVDGPLLNAQVEVFTLADYIINGENSTSLLLSDAPVRSDASTGLIDNLTLSITSVLDALVLVVTADANTIDLTTGEAPVVTQVVTVIRDLDIYEPVFNPANSSYDLFRRHYATPLTSLALGQAIEVATANNELTELGVLGELNNAQRAVKNLFGFGMASTIDIFTTSPILDEVTAQRSLQEEATQGLQEEVGQYRLAIETFVKAIAAAAAASGQDTGVLMQAITADIADGVMDDAATDAVFAAINDTANWVTADAIKTLLETESTGLNIPLEPGVEFDDASSPDSDQDGAPNDVDVWPQDPERDLDTDADGVDDSLDNCPEVSNADQSDIDSDGSGDVCDSDRDDDGVNDFDVDGVTPLDNCPAVANGPEDASNQLDLDIDGLGDVCDSDIDGDTVDNAEDNCPIISNPSQSDSPDDDGLGDACDPDRDNDGVNDFTDDGVTPLDNCPIDVNSLQEDYDLDGLGNVCDSDGDDDGFEGPFGGGNGTESATDDLDEFTFPGESDGDGTLDVADNCPLTPNADQAAGSTNALGKSVPFGVACDADDDGYPSPNQNLAGTLGDGIPVDNCPATANADQDDLDSDGFGDACDPDIDGDGIPNTADPQPTVAVSDYHFSLLYTQQSSDATDYKVATVSESVLQSTGFVDTASANSLNLGTTNTGVGTYGIASDYETIENSVAFAGSGCVPDCLATAVPTSVITASLVIGASTPAAAYDTASERLTFEAGATTLAPWGTASFVGAGRVTLAGVGSTLADVAQQGLSALSYTDTSSNDADLSGEYGFVDLSVNYGSGANTADGLVATQTRVFDAQLNGAGVISAEGVMSQFNAAVGTDDGSVTFANTTLGLTGSSYSVIPSGATTLTFATETFSAIADADGELLSTVSGDVRGFGVKLGAATAADLVAQGPYNLEGLVINPERAQVTGFSLEGATLTFSDVGGGEIKANLSLNGEGDRDASVFSAAGDALPAVTAVAGPGGSHQSESFTMASNGRFGPIGFGLGTATKPFDIEGFFVPGKGLLLRYVESIIKSTGGASSSVQFACGDPSVLTFVNPNTQIPLPTQPTNDPSCGFVIQGSAGNGERLSDLGRAAVDTPQIFTVIEGLAETVLTGDGFAQGIVWGIPSVQ